ncbi:MAG: Tad domain-containing protein, partial [Desulfobulbaceae bacterium]|nr:Tad domain-containing protein [Desulfobulbaceae bacterium]
MEKRTGYRWLLQNQSGATLLLVAFSMVILLGVAAFAIDFGYRHVTRNELQNIADGAALASARQLGVIYKGILPADQQTYDPSTMDADGNGTIDKQQIIQIAQAVGTSNKAAQQAIAILANEVEIGTWISGVFTPTDTHPNAVRVKSRRDTTANSPITTFFAR